MTWPRAGAKAPELACCVGPARLCLEALGILDHGLAQLWCPWNEQGPRQRRKGDGTDGDWMRPRSSTGAGSGLRPPPALGKPAAWVLLGHQTMPASRAPEVHGGLKPCPWGPGSWTAGWSQVWRSHSGSKDEPAAGLHWPSPWAIPCKSLSAGHAGRDVAASKRFSLTLSSTERACGLFRRWLTLACLPVVVAGGGLSQAGTGTSAEPHLPLSGTGSFFLGTLFSVSCSPSWLRISDRNQPELGAWPLTQPCTGTWLCLERADAWGPDRQQPE